jgi:hypothetical protein
MAWKITVDEAGEGRIVDTTILEWKLGDALEILCAHDGDLNGVDDDSDRSFQITVTPVS